MGVIAFKGEQPQGNTNGTVGRFSDNFGVTNEFWNEVFDKALELIKRTNEAGQTLAQLNLLYPNNRDVCVAVISQLQVIHAMADYFSQANKDNPNLGLGFAVYHLAKLGGII